MPLNIGVVIPARLGSSRLKRKHLLESCGKPMLEWLVLRQIKFNPEIQRKIVIATTTEYENKELHELAAKLGVKSFAGCKENMPKRFVEVCQFYGFDGLVCIDGDDIFASPNATTCSLLLLQQGFENVASSMLPLGMNVSGFSKRLLIECLANQPQLILETGWTRILPALSEAEICFRTFEKFLDFELRLTLDYEEDFRFFDACINKFKELLFEMNDLELIDLIVKSKFFELNRSVSTKYWQNFHAEIECQKTLIETN